MAMICYRDLDGNLVSIRNPTKADDDEMWRVFWVRNKEAFHEELIKQVRQNCPILSKLLALGPLATG